MSRSPQAFRIDPPKPEPQEKPVAKRAPRAIDPGKAVTVTADPVDFFSEPDAALSEPPPIPARRRSLLARIFFAALGLLVSLAIGLWADRLIRDLFARADWLGWIALGAAAVALLALLTIVSREVLALMRLASIEEIRRSAADAIIRDDAAEARKILARLSALVAAKPETAAGRKTLDSIKDDVIDGSDLLALAEKELLAPLDAMARKQVLDAAKRVSVVTAVSPRALVDVLYVLFEAARLTRRIAEIYGGRPGFLGFLHLVRSVLAHLAVTGSMAAGETLMQQIVGHGLAARLSAKLGEGVVNGMMTARIGIAAMAAARPLAFNALPRPGIGDFLKTLTSFASSKAEEKVAAGEQ
ncbi:YcjF family protein [Nitratireductor sp. ZSWI3]|uniref:YcjF family protein n=1 Tax=Nitratireductor sp. ZSWI3 TaxID=2966359 RepID=UPI0021503F32|nr:TIGR01620 family protein [Nitratireductor sp. ZSWI3]MCR4268915.1 TIGR01620 family protein [Nitratireductor sp. ZSWI3]